MSSTRTTPRTRVMLAIAATLAVALSGCAPSESTPAASPGADAEPLTLNVGQISNSVAFFPIFVAESEGLFTAENPTRGADRPRLGTGAKLAAALQSGSIDVGGGVMTDAFNLYKVNDKARVIGALVNSYYVDIVVGSDFDGPSASASLEDRIDALKGKTIGITGPGSGTEAFINYLLLQQDLDPKTDVTLVNLGADASAAIGALKTHKVDALSFFQPIGQQAEATDVGQIYISPTRGDVPSLDGAMHGIVFTTQDVIDKKGPAVAAFLRAIKKAEELIQGDPAKVTTLFEAYQASMEPATVKALIPIIQQEMPKTPQPIEKGYDQSADFHLKTGLVAKAPSYKDIVPDAWIAKALKG
jgi:NitT/TauT family transport system substrate-binding protein